MATKNAFGNGENEKVKNGKGYREERDEGKHDHENTKTDDRRD
jgi:hypothetical protein